MENYPKYFSPFRFFPMEVVFWIGNRLWNGTFDTDSTPYMYEMWKTTENNWHDELVVQLDKIKYYTPVKTTEIDITSKFTITRDVAKTLIALGIPGYPKDVLLRVRNPPKPQTQQEWITRNDQMERSGRTGTYDG